MRTPLPVQCSNCKKTHDVFVQLHDLRFVGLCDCGQHLSGCLGNTVTIGIRLLYRSSYEFRINSDFSLSIVFSATAMECELSRLFFKWTRIENLHNGVHLSDTELDNSIRHFRTIDAKIEEVAKLMYPAGLSAFVQARQDLRDMITGGFTSIDLNSLSSSFQEKLFWPRNRILHLGETLCDSDHSKRCYNMARLGVHLFHELDVYKMATL